MTPTLRDDLAADLRKIERDTSRPSEDIADELIALGWTKPLPVVRRLREERDEARAEVARLREGIEELPERLRYHLDSVQTQFGRAVTFLLDPNYPIVGFADSGSATFDADPPVVGPLAATAPLDPTEYPHYLEAHPEATP